MTKIFAKIQAQLTRQYPFAVYCKPESNKITGIFQTTDELFYSENFTEEGFVFAPFSNGKTALIPLHSSEVITGQNNPAVSLPPEPRATVIDIEVKKSFENLVRQCISAIQSGTFSKLVTSRKETLPVPDMEIVSVFQKLMSTYPMAFRYMFYTPETSLWLGATPEQLLKVEVGTLHTVALAGTQVYKGAEDTVWENKERHEQRFVTDYIVESLKDVSEDITIGDPYTFRAGNLIHIKTDIKAKVSDACIYNIVNALHPTPAVCGLPKNEAQQFLLDNEGYDREYYSGFLGEINKELLTGNPDYTDLYVNLRCMNIKNKNAHLYIGCGITKDSDPEKEFIETVNKSMTMRRVLGS